MHKTCNKCKNFNSLDKFCNRFKMKITDVLTATYCIKYSASNAKKDLIKKNISCCYCINMNKYGWCYEKKKCFSDDEKYKKRQCIKFKQRKSKKK